MHTKVPYAHNELKTSMFKAPPHLHENNMRVAVVTQRECLEFQL